MPEFEIEINEGEDRDDLAELCGMYWTTSEDGSFTYTVEALAKRFGEPSHRISRLVSKSCFARSTSRRCSECNQGFVYKSRSEWNSSTRHVSGRCRTCIQAEEQRLRKERERANAEMRNQVLQLVTVVDDESEIYAEDLDMSAAFVLAALLEDAEEISQGITTPVCDRTDRLTPTPNYDHKLLRDVSSLGLVKIHPSSSLDAFVWEEDRTLGEAYHPARASFYLCGSGSLASRADAYLKNFAQTLSRTSWPDRWVDRFSAFWFDVATAECEAYLVYLLRQHGLNFTPGQKTDEVLRRALKWYSIGQVYYFIWRAAKDSTAYRARERVSAKQAANSAVTRISTDIERAYANGWQVSTFRRDSRLPLSTLSHILFRRALELDDPMSYSPAGLPMRRAGLELAWENIDSRVFEQLIFQLVAETDGYENVEWLMHTNAPDHGRDVSAFRTRRDPLSGHSSQRVAIQCKHWLTRPIRDVDVNSAIVSISHWDSPPFDVLVIATSGRFTADAVSWIERHNSGGGRPSVEMWNDARLELLLNERLHLVRAYELR
ncbi:restriction endonuclease [Natronosporangium hydrolyticum]|uniref:Restriction endonuclease n=1 Tax=Natronosporangium hydrolyticum TaxID=2811111 RepID=A0A895Y9M2_9ACTN|nr:restriction endonuclease [Natronosporangium hydrolyticum]QSB14031.1 restriction endonuclease [Natronosporangium hydrolyticum]